MVKKKKVLIILHGLGDNLVLFPVIYDYYLQHDKQKIYLIVLNNGAKEFWEAINFVEKVFTVNPGGQPHYWNPVRFFFKDYPLCISLARQALSANNVDNYDLVFIKGNLIPNTIDKTLFGKVDRHKITNAYKELHLQPESVYEPLQLEDFFRKPHDVSVIETFFKENNLKKQDYILVHRKSFYDKKNIAKEQIIKLVKKFPDKKFVLIMDQQMYNDEQKNEGGSIKLKNVIYTTKYQFSILDIYFLLKYSVCNILIDSSIMHLAQFVNSPTVVVFKTKFNPNRIVPFNGNITYRETRDEKLELFIFEEFILSNAYHL